MRPASRVTSSHDATQVEACSDEILRHSDPHRVPRDPTHALGGEPCSPSKPLQNRRHLGGRERAFAAARDRLEEGEGGVGKSQVTGAFRP